MEDKVFEYDGKFYSEYEYSDGIDGSLDDLLEELANNGEVSRYNRGYNYLINEEYMGNDWDDDKESILDNIYEYNEYNPYFTVHEVDLDNSKPLCFGKYNEEEFKCIGCSHREECKKENE